MRWFVRLVFVAFVSLVFLWITPVKVVYTMDRSLPYKWWLWMEGKDFKLGDYVEFKPPVEDQYTKGKVLVKQVACVHPQVLQVRDLAYYCDGKFLGKARLFDSKGRPVKPFVVEAVVPKDCFFALGENERSYDSRYFGFVCREHVRARVYPLAQSPDLDWLFMRE